MTEPRSEDVAHFKCLDQKRKRMWTKLQLCFDLIPQLPSNKDIFKIRASQLNSVVVEYNDTLDELDLLGTKHKDFILDTVQLSSSFDTLYYQILAKVKELDKADATSTAKVGLPEIQIPRFDGTYEKFGAFISLYDNLIHNTSLPDIEKFSYLLSYLDKSALRLIQTVVFAPENYHTAYDLLTKRYKNKRYIANHYLTQILTLNPIKSENPQAIKQLIDIIQTNVTSIKALNVGDLADYILLEITLRLLDNRTRKIFETKYVNDISFPKLEQLFEFLESQSKVSDLLSTNPSISNKVRTSSFDNIDKRRVHIAVHETSQVSTVCALCKENHSLHKCSSFLAATPRSRYEIVKTQKKCYACFGAHLLSQCKSIHKCRTCGSKLHNTLLHFDNSLKVDKVVDCNEPQATCSQSLGVTSISSGNNLKNLSKKTSSFAILGTAQALVQSITGDWIRCRLVLDPGSQVNIITTRLANCLKLPRLQCPFSLSGVGQSSLNNSQGMISCKLSSIYSTDTTIDFRAVILPSISGNLPSIPLSSEIRNRFTNLRLADPHFTESAPIDILLGVESSLDITPPQPEYIQGRPAAMLTSLGWIILGAVDSLNSSMHSITSMHIHLDSFRSIDNNLRAFWENEEIPSQSHISSDDKTCETYFRETITKLSNHYQTRLPFKDGIRPTLGSNREYALDRFLKLENRFKRDPEFYRLYSDNIRDYVDQGQLVPALRSAPYILTHHGVRKNSPSGISVRVVFNPAEKDSRGLSLNDSLLSGPKLQADIGQVITRFRLPRIALTCDIRQMFRAIYLHPDDRQYQHIFWRFAPDEPVREWEHTRVIFGATSSPYLAQRTIKQLVEDSGENYPLAAAALKHGTYIDDILWGADDETTAIELRNQLIQLLKLGGFELGKWASSCQSVISLDENFTHKLPDSSSSVKVLGLAWNPNKDILHYVIDFSNEPATKRGILSRIARIYDINGYLSPFVFSLKVILQQLWAQKIDWDTALPQTILDRWSRITQELSLLEKISLPRCIFNPLFLNARLVGFSDASTFGMGAVIYLRIELSNSILVNLVVAKTRVAPLKSWTIPRLELGAAWLLSKLVYHITPSFSHLALDFPICFTDSMTTLSWVNTSPHLLKTFVANRVSQINEYLPHAEWRHISGIVNPADPASRGLLPSELLHCKLWWEGPSFLYKPLVDWPKQPSICQSNIPELKTVNLVSNLWSIDSTSFVSLFERISSLVKLQRILAYILRFIHNLRNKTDSKNRRFGPLCGEEYQNALVLAARLTQAQHLNRDILALDKGHLCSKRYRNLTPFLDSRGLVMVGGRLKHASLAQSSKHPILIPYESRLATLLVDHFHLYSGHGGPQLVQSLIHRHYWIPSARRLIRKRIFQCLTCYRFKAKPIQPPMADLPSYRIQPSRTFSHTGVDFAGPFLVKSSLLRSSQSVKCYVAIFICMVTKAVHFETVTNLATDGFLAAFDRFIARRGLPCQMYSDQGRNFRGAAREISETYTMLNDSNRELTDYLASRHVEWSFNPPYAPNFGGIWEAGVKSFKHHFKRVVGNQVLSLEEFITVTTRIEGILNSRPLCPLSTSPDDGFDYLTPGHFIIGDSILARPEYEILDISKNRLDRWQLTRQLLQSFWKRWSKEYLHTQLFRPKWASNPSIALSEGDLVFWYAPGMLPTQWPKGRVIRLIPGDDGVARVAKIKTPTGDILRPINKIVPLPPN